MIYPFAGLLLGAVAGVLHAQARGGTWRDKAQWGAVYAMICGLIGLFVLVFIERSLT